MCRSVIDGTLRQGMKILFVCTANQCRSPMAEALLRRHLTEREIPAEVSSCGLLEGNMPAAEIALEAMKDFDLDLSDHRSRRVSRYLIDESDLILTMTREHLREIVVNDPSSFGKTFTLKELVRRARANPRQDNEALPEYLARIGLDRRPHDLMGDSPEDDVADPMLQGSDACRDTAQELNQLTRDIANVLASTP